MLLAVDASLSGWGAAWGSKDSPRPHTAVMTLPQGEHNYERALASARSWVTMMCKAERVRWFLIEAAMPKVDRDHSFYSAFLLISLQAVAREAAHTCGAEVHAINVKTWRSHFIGNGNMPGDEAKRAVMRRCDQIGYKYQDHNSAESAGLWDYGIHTFCRRSSLLARSA